MKIRSIPFKMVFMSLLVIFALSNSFGQKNQDLGSLNWKSPKNALLALDANESAIFQIPTNEVFNRPENEYLSQFLKRLKIHLSDNVDVMSAIEKSKSETSDTFKTLRLSDDDVQIGFERIFDLIKD